MEQKYVKDDDPLNWISEEVWQKQMLLFHGSNTHGKEKKLKQKNTPLLYLNENRTDLGSREKPCFLEQHFRIKTHTHHSQKKDLQWAHNFSSFFLPSRPVIVHFRWQMSHIQSSSEHRPRVNEHTINSHTVFCFQWLIGHLFSRWVLIDKPRTKVSSPLQLWKHPGFMTTSFEALKWKSLVQTFLIDIFSVDGKKIFNFNKRNKLRRLEVKKLIVFCLFCIVSHLYFSCCNNLFFPLGL